jgi:alkyl hydroperoxide reductase subunit AhpC
MEALEEYIEDLDDLETVALGISVDPVPSKRAWAESMDIEETALLSDFWPHGEVAQAYGIFREEDGVSQRAAFIVDEDGIVQWKKIYAMDEVPDMDEILDNLENT